MAKRARRVNQTFKKLPELQDALDDLLSDFQDGRVVGEAFKDVLRDAAEPVREDAVRLAPVKDGDLRKAIFASRGDKEKPSAIVGVNHEKAPHGQLVEFGHAGPKPAPPHPFMRPAIERNRTKVRQIIADGTAKIIKKHT